MNRLPYHADVVEPGAVEPVAGPVPASLSTGPGAGPSTADAREVLCRFRWDVYACLDARADVLFELADALACAAGPVQSLPELSLEPEHRRGHGGLYDALNAGRIEFARIRRTLVGLPLPRVGERLVLGVDVTPWLPPDAETSPDRLFCHVHGRAKGTSQMIPGWPYSIVAALETGRTSWTAVLDAVRLGPDDDATAVTAVQLRDVVEMLIVAGHWRPGDPPIEIVMDSGYDVTRLAFVLADLPVVLTGRLRSDRVMLRPVAPRQPDTMGRPPATARGCVHPEPAGHLADARPRHHYRDEPVRHSDRIGMGTDAPAPDSSRRLAGPPRGPTVADRGGHPDPPPGRSPAR